jgi:hypothetical protein
MRRPSIGQLILAVAGLLLAAGCQATRGEGTAALPTAAASAGVTPSEPASPAAPTASPAPAPLVVAGLGEGDSAEVTSDGDVAYVNLFSEDGIGQADVTLAEGAAPADIILRLYLTGLEELRFQYGQITVIASVSSGEGHAVQQSVENSLAMRPAPEPIGPESPYWLEIAIAGDNGSAPFPLKNSYFEVHAPADFLTGDQRAFAVRWVDFFR